MISDFPWRKMYDGTTEVEYYYNVVTSARADTLETIPLPPDWYFDDSDNFYYNDTLCKQTEFLPGQLFENEKLGGYPYKRGTTDGDGKLVYQHRRTKEYCKESDIDLPEGWNRGVTHAGELYYWNEGLEEYSYRLPGELDRPLNSNHQLFQKLIHMKEELDESKYYLFHREVLSRCEQAVTYDLVKGVGTEEIASRDR